VGSSSQRQAFEPLVSILKERPVTLIAAVGGEESGVEGNFHYTPWLDGIQACRRARLMIGNGGAMSCHQALAADIPVLGLCSNMDQMLNMQAMESQERGWRMVAGKAEPERFIQILSSLGL
jgi:UDP:flavonoid glycosyltransferase YjiC (YdhE family)